MWARSCGYSVDGGFAKYAVAGFQGLRMIGSIVGTREDPTQVFSLLALAHGSKVIPSVCQRPFASGDGPSNMET
jgi:D-arabinose 1-dehydrogenase-like Zn-dependent alcohol dehydrogenase